MTLLSSRVHQVCPGPVGFALRRILAELGTDDDWSIVCAFSANHGVEAVHAAAREMLADLPLASSLVRRQLVPSISLALPHHGACPPVENRAKLLQ